MADTTGQIVLPEGQSALELLYTLLEGAVAAFPDALREAQFSPDLRSFRKSYPDVLPRLEAARIATDARLDVAALLARGLAERMLWQDERGTQPLADALTETVPPLPLVTRAFDATSGWQPSITYRGRRYDAADLEQLADLLVERRVATAAAGRSLGWIGENALDDGALHLSGRKVAVLGGGAEMAPTRFWLEAGADVFWLDTRPPPAEWFNNTALGGRLFWVDGNADLLTQPREVLATLIAFAEGTPLDLGLYAYAPGQARELRLTASMNALVGALPAELINSVTMLVSPTTPTALNEADLDAMAAHSAARPVWEKGLAALGLLGLGGGVARAGEGAATRTVVSIQGASYQAAQYLGKIMTAESWAASGLRISANTAAITRTRSLDHPVFAAAFGGAAALGVETMTPRQSRRLNGLLAVSDWLSPDLPRPGEVRIHGGIHTLPYPLGSALRAAAAIGFARSPRLLRGLFGGRA